MKRIVKIVLLIILPFTLLGQKKHTVTTYWISERYIDSVVLNGTKSKYKEYLKPIEAITTENGKWHIGTYNGMFQPLIQSSKANTQGIPIMELSLNANAFTRQEQDSISKIRYFIKAYDDSLILKAYRGNNLLESKKYIRQFKSYKFEELRKTTRVLSLQGIYNIYDFNGEKIESEIEITFNGTINRSQRLHSWELKRVLIPDENNNFYDLIEFHSKNKVIKKLAIIYNREKNSWMGYEYQVNKDKYSIHISPRFILRMQKIL